MEVNWIKVLSTEDAIKAELAKSVLQSHQIESVVVNKQDSAYVVLGFSEVLVPEEQAEQALEILKTQDLV
jgi:hypothetical protein